MQNEMPWYDAALNEYEKGVKEIRGDEHNPDILKYHDSTSLKATDDETAWCSSFVNWCMEVAGEQGTNSAAARSWLKWGRKITEPEVGCVVVFARGNSSWQGHVGFVRHVNADGSLDVLGGNQSNAVSIKTYSTDRLLGYRMPV